MFTHYTITLKGVTPLLQHAMPHEVLLGLAAPKGGRNKNEKGSTNTINADGTPNLRAICEQHLYRDPCDAAKLVLPQAQMFASLREAGRQFKLGKQQISTRDSTVLPSFLALDPGDCQIMNPTTGKPAEWEVDVRRGVNKAAGVAICVVRPRFDRWQVTVGCQLNVARADDTLLRRIFDEAGTAVGVGSFRPERGGMFGRFSVVRWEQTDLPAEEDAAE